MLIKKQHILLILLAFCLFIAPKAQAAVTLLTGFPLGAPPQTYTTSTDTTGASLLVVACGFYGANPCTSTSSISDNMSNNWVIGNSYYTPGSNGGMTIFYTCNPITTSTWQVESSPSYSYITVWAFSGTATSSCMQAQNGINPPNSSPFQPGSVAMTNGGVVITAIDSNGNAANASVDSGFSTPSGSNNSSHDIEWASYLISTSTGSVNPTWTTTGDTDWAGAIMSFYAAGGAPPPTPPPTKYWLQGVFKFLGNFIFQ